MYNIWLHFTHSKFIVCFIWKESLIEVFEGSLNVIKKIPSADSNIRLYNVSDKIRNVKYEIVSFFKQDRTHQKFCIGIFLL